MAVIGAILGDICGSRFEFSKDIDWEDVPLFDENRCEFTDDTVMTLAIKDALIRGKDLVPTMQKYGRLYPGAGYGGRFSSWLESKDPRPYNSFGNGAAMRVSAVADFYSDLDDVKEMARQTAEFSHNHPEGIKGAVVTAACIWMAKNGKSKEEIRKYVLESYPANEYKYNAGMSMEYLRQNATWEISCQGSVPVAVCCFLESTDFESFMRNIFSIECDRDTLGAIGGGIAEEYYHGVGFDPQPILERYLDKRLLTIANAPCEKSGLGYRIRELLSGIR